MPKDLRLIKQLRDQTNLSVAACERAIEQAGGDKEKALLLLRKESARAAEKKAARGVPEGVIGVYQHSNKRIGVLIEVRCETDFVAKNEEFRAFAHNIAMHIAALNPQFVSLAEIPLEHLDRMRALFREEAGGIDKSEAVRQKIIDGKLEHYKKEVVLLEQAYIKNQDQTVEMYAQEAVQKFGENIRIVRFSRFEIS